MRDLRARRVLRQFEEQARHQALSRHGSPDHKVIRARRGLGVVLRGWDLFRDTAGKRRQLSPLNSPGFGRIRLHLPTVIRYGLIIAKGKMEKTKETVYQVVEGWE